MPLLLAIDDDPSILEFFKAFFAEPEIALETAGSLADGLSKFSSCHPDVVLLDMDLPDGSGLDGFRRIHALDPKTPVIFLTGHGSTETAIEATALGAYDYLHKPPNVERLRELVLRTVEVNRLMHVPALIGSNAPESDLGTDSLVGRCAPMLEVCKAIGRVAPQNVTCLILGESGTGKELVARAIYHYSRRSAGPFLAINCAAIPENLLESELFGHEKGSFTGADSKRVGKFEQCSGGTLFLDEIGDMAPLTQAKILRVLQNQQFERVGGRETIQTDVRLIAATHRNLEQAVAAGQFRGDLFYRLNVYTIQLPPLRERGRDVPLLVDHFVRRFSLELGKEVRQVAPETMDLLVRYNWPGNVRELQSVLKNALLQAQGPVLLPEFLPASFPRLSGGLGTSGGQALDEWDQFLKVRLLAGTSALYAEWQALTDTRLFRYVLRHTQGNLSQAAHILGINRATLRTKMEALGIKNE